MAFAATINTRIDVYIANLRNFVHFSKLYLQRHNLFQMLQNDMINFIKTVLTFQKKVEIAKYRVNHLSYRLDQMEKIIEHNNPYNLKKVSFNQVR